MAKNDRDDELTDKVFAPAKRHGQSLKPVHEKLAEMVASLRRQMQQLEGYARSRARGAQPKDAGPGGQASELPKKTVVAELAARRDMGPGPSSRRG